MLVAQPLGRHRPSAASRTSRVDATDADALTAAVQGADVLYNCANPTYRRWPTDWPPLWPSLLDAAARTGAVLVTVGQPLRLRRRTAP